MSYIALYRKFRPAEFSDVKGQDHIVTTLKNQICADRIGHAYLFCGTRGTGKTTVAKIFAKAVNCEHPVDGNPCKKCASCQTIAAGNSMDVIEIDAASNNSVDNIREIRDEVAYSPTEGKYKVYIIDEVHMLSIGAFNALLKTLEEPPSYVIFILATTEANRIPITILSRCQRYDFRRITVNTIETRLKELMEKEQIDVEEWALNYIAKAADGSMRDALSLLDQCIAFYLGQKLTYENVLEVLGAVDIDVFSGLLQKIIDQDLTGAICQLEEIILTGRELSQFVIDFIWYLRNLLMLKCGQGMEELVDISEENLKQMKMESDRIDQDTILRFIRIFSELSGQLRYTTQKRVLVEIALIKLCKPYMEKNYDSILQRLSQVEKKLEQGVFSIPKVSQPEQKSEEYIEQEKEPKQELSLEMLPTNVKEFVERFSQLCKKASPMYRLMLKDAQARELPEHSGVQIILKENYAVDENELAMELERLATEELHSQIKVNVSMPKTDKRSGEASIDLSKSIDMEIEIDTE